MKDDVHRLQEKFKETYEGTQAGSPESKGLLIGPISSTYQIGLLDLGLGVWPFVRVQSFWMKVLCVREQMSHVDSLTELISFAVSTCGQILPA